MPRIEVTEEQILRSMQDLSPEGRREALKRLLCGADWLDELFLKNRARIEAAARERGVAWDLLSEELRERLIDQILHEG